MDVSYGEQPERYRSEIRDFLTEHLPADWAGAHRLPDDERDRWVDQWRVLLSDRGLLAPAWPAQYGGGGLSHLEQVVLHEEFTRAGVPAGAPTDVLSVGLLGPTLIVAGTEEQRRHYLPRILSGEDRWCQGYSEPDAGSDLAGLRTTAEQDGDEWVINGQKIWTSHAHKANWVFVLCRTDPSAPKHRGISFLLCPMDQPGVEVRPIGNAAGSHEFNEVFFSDARTAVSCIVGEPNEGWKVANAMLAFERGGDATTVPLVMRSLLEQVVTVARATGAVDDPVMRQRLSGLESRVQILGWSGLRTLTSVLQGDPLSARTSVSKVQWTELYQDLSLVAVDVLGASATGHDAGHTHVPLPPDAMSDTLAATWISHLLCSRAASIYSGSNEIQRNVIGERLLGLPREPRPDGR